VIPSLEFTVAAGRKFVDTLDGFRKKRKVSSYDAAGGVRRRGTDVRPRDQPVSQARADGIQRFPTGDADKAIDLDCERFSRSCGKKRRLLVRGLRSPRLRD
jgi:hypothetical protein